MNLSKKEVLTVEKPQQSPTKLTTLNPNAAEFIPSSLKSVSGRSNTAEASFDFASSASVTLGKTVLDRSGSSIPINSDEEAHQYWCRQLPDDITPDFKVMEDDDDSIGVKNLSFSNLSLSDVTDSPHLPGTGFMRKDLTAFSPNHVEGRSFLEHLRYPVSSHGEDLVSSSFHHFSSNPWGDRKTVSRDQFLSNLRDGSSYCGKSRHGFLSNTINDQQYSGHADNNPVEFLASQFPGFAADSLAEVYFANGGDLNLTIEMLTQLELQVDGDFGQNEKSKVFSAPNLSLMDFPALSTSDNNNTVPKFSDDKTPQSVDLYRSSDTDNLNFFKSGPSVSSIGPIDFASAVRKMALQDSAMWKYDRNNGSASANVGSSRNSQLLASSYNSGQVKGLSGDRLQSRGSSRSTPVWLETGEAVANMYSEMREDAREHARLRNAYFEQARQAYLVGNKALAKELSAKGQLHNAQMKAAHGKAQDSIYRLRNPEIQGNGRIHGGGAGRTIDLHGLHVSEALQVLKRELTSLRNEARSAGQRMQVYICVGTGHHTRGSRTPARLPLAVQRYLLEGEGLDFSEPQPGLLRVVIY